jgi:uncharacterized protein (DUF608 family)
MNKNFVDVSDGLGIPFGGIGTGYSMFGQYGFASVNYDSVPDEIRYTGQENHVWVNKPECEADWAFVIHVNERSILLQKNILSWLPNIETIDDINCFAHLPKGYFNFKIKDLDLKISMTVFSPMEPHNLENSTIPVHIFDFSIENSSSIPIEIQLELIHSKSSLKNQNEIAVWSNPHGDIAFACKDGNSEYNKVYKKALCSSEKIQSIRFALGWYYPNFRTPSPEARQHYKRYYTKRFKDALSVVKHGLEQAGEWSKTIDQWHNSYQVPAEFHRLWFSSLSSVITSTMMSADPYFFEIETPHHWVNTMDVGIYSSWLYMINWPELERMDMNQYFSVIPTSGTQKGFVWHSIWSDACHYVEEPAFLLRVYRDYLWFNDLNWLSEASIHAENAAEFVYQQDNYKYLIASKHGNQSYDLWKMPGISSYVNSAWIYGLYALEKIAIIMGKDIYIGGIPIKDLRQRAVDSFQKTLWNDVGYWNCFQRTPDARIASVPESVFSDQLFGRWVASLDLNINKVLPVENVKEALQKIYQHNLVIDGKFRGWVNGRLPDGNTDNSGLHSKVFWVCGQLDLGSLLGEYGFEKESIDVFKSFETSLGNNHLAVGEWNQSLTVDRKTERLWEEHGKDTPRFPSYPRYKCCWEYLIRMLGLKLDDSFIYLSPFKTIDFSFKNIILGGVNISIEVQTKWTKVFLDGKELSGEIKILRDKIHHKIKLIA